METHQNMNEVTIETANEATVNESTLTIAEEDVPEKLGQTSCINQNHSSRTSITSENVDTNNPDNGTLV